MIRKPAVAGQFYPASKAHLEKEVKGYLVSGAKIRDAIGVISPHAGYMYSGHVAGAVFSAVNIPERVVVLSPNHTGMGTRASIMPEGEWEMPTGSVKIDSDLASALMKNCPELKADVTAHLAEHSLEVQLPFLQIKYAMRLQDSNVAAEFTLPSLKFVPITVSHLGFGVCEIIGNAIAKTIKSPHFSKGGQGGINNILIVASSDMTHYEPQEQVNEKDQHAIDKVLALDPRGLLDICARERITMCGVIPSVIMLIAAKELGATKGELIKHATSGDITGDYSSVVGYAGMIVY